ncbi:MAG: hypothetical protein Kow00128_00670 [Deltaproteobacteria bacterium]
MIRPAGCGIRAGAALLLSASIACAADGSGAPSFFWASVRMLLSLGVVLAILLLVSRYSRKVLDRVSRPGASAGSVAVREARRIGPKAQLVVVEAFGRTYLLGVSPSGVSVVDTLPAGRAEEAE